jgi:hypothetical protein
MTAMTKLKSKSKPKEYTFDEEISDGIIPSLSAESDTE